LLYDVEARFGHPTRIDVAAEALLDGSLVLQALDLSPGRVRFNLLSAAGGIHGRFATYELPELRQGQFWRIDYEPNSVAVEVVNLLQGDYNGNGAIEQGDLDLVLLNWGAGAMTPPEGWVNDLPSGLIDQDELDRVLSSWGDLGIMPFQGAVAVPEPASSTILLVCLLIALSPRLRGRA
jgi:hypothetical protein